MQKLAEMRYQRKLAARQIAESAAKGGSDKNKVHPSKKGQAKPEKVVVK